MAKRMTDTEKWKKPFLKGLPPEYKLLWFYILDDCDHVGIWQVDMEVAEIRLGVKLSEEKARGLFKEKVVAFDNGTKWFIPDFIDFQYGVLTEKNKMYNPVLSVLKKYNLMGHLSPINGGKEKDKDKDKDKVKEKDTEGGAGETNINGSQLVPTICRRWYEKFPTYTQDQKLDFQAVGKIVAFMCQQAGVRDVTDPKTVEKILATMDSISDLVAAEPFWINKPLSTIANSIQNFYNQLKNPQHEQRRKQAKPDIRADFQAEFSKRYGNG
ncbi:hypothetical protein Pan5_50 [Pseudanabaena phage Pan5]|nr:hypothetical protein Pan5_50 [Pseudanabaena phage Pan5]